MSSSEDAPQQPSPKDSEPIAEPLGAGFNFADPNSPLAPYYLRTADLIGIVLLAAIVWFYSQIPLWHTDIWGHALYGEWFLNLGSFASHEPFTPFADKKVELVQTQWLTQAIYAFFLRIGNNLGHGDPQRSLECGVELLRSFHVFVLAGRFILMWLAFRRISGSSSAANVALLLLFAAMIQPSAIQRPQAIGMLCFAGLLYALSRPRISRRSVIGLPILFLLWANLHGSFLAGLAFFYLFVIGRLIEDRRQPNVKSWAEVLQSREVLRMIQALVLSSVAVCLNPHGPMLYIHVLTFAERPNITDLDEWQAMRFHLGPGAHWAFIGSWTLLLVVWGMSGRTGKVRMAAALPFGIWPLLQERAMIWWLMLVPWLLAGMGPALAKRFDWLGKLPSSVPDFKKTILALLIIFVTFLWLPPIQWITKGRPRPLEQSLSGATLWRLGLEFQATGDRRGRWLPAYAAGLKGYPDERFHGAIFSSESLGDYLLRVAPMGSSVMVYTHAHVFPVAHWRESMNAKFALGDWNAWLAQYGVNMVVVEPDLYAKLVQALRADPEWLIVLDESGANRNRGDRQFIAIRKRPLVKKQ